MNILVIGGTGFISTELVRRLVEGHHRVTLFTRGLHERLTHGHKVVEYLHGDRTLPREFQRLLGRRTFDAVFDMIAYLPAESAAAAGFFRGRTARFIHCSTVSVYMVSSHIRCPITEDQAAAPPMEYWPGNPFGMDYGLRKRECEEILWRAHDEKLLPVSMLRPTFVSGPGDPARRDYFWMQRIADGGPLLVPGTGEHPFQQVFVRDVARAFVSLLHAPATIGRAYNIAGEEEFTLNEYLRELADLMHRGLDIVRIPQEQFDGLTLSSHPGGDVFPFNTRRTAVFSLEAIHKDTGYRPTPFREWMGETVLWWMGLPRGHSIGYERREDELRIAAEWAREPLAPTAIHA